MKGKDNAFRCAGLLPVVVLAVCAAFFAGTLLRSGQDWRLPVFLTLGAASLLLVAGALTHRAYLRQLILYRAMDKSGVVSFSLDEGLTLLYANDRSYQIFGCDKACMRLRYGSRLANLIHPSDLENVRKAIASAVSADGSYVSWDMRVRPRDGGVKHVLIGGVICRRGTRHVLNGVAVDITDQKQGDGEAALYRRELAYRRSMEPRFRTTFLYDVTRRVQVDMGSPVPEERAYFTGASIEEFGRLAAGLVEEDGSVRNYFRSMTPELLEKRAEREMAPVVLEYLRKMPAGEARWMHFEAHLLREPETGHLMAFFYVTDINDQKTVVQELEAAAQTDAMTGLLNHEATLRDIKRFLEMEGSEARHALCVIDLDSFKNVNDSYGHQCGDAAIKSAAAAIRATFRTSDIVGRTGGDEFMVLIKNTSADGMVRRKAQELMRALSAQQDARIRLSASLGVGIFDRGDKSFEQLYNDADAALYRAKRTGKNRYCLSCGEAAAFAGTCCADTGSAAPGQPPLSDAPKPDA